MEIKHKVNKSILYSIVYSSLLSLLLISCASFTTTNQGEKEQLLATGENYVMNEEYIDAIDLYKRVLSYEADNVEALYGLAQSYLLSGDLASSAEVISTLATIESSKRYSLTKTYASLLYDDGEVEKSLKVLHDLYETNPYDKELAFILIERYLEHGFFSKAYIVATTLYEYHFNDKQVIKKIADITEQGNLPYKESWKVVAHQ